MQSGPESFTYHIWHSSQASSSPMVCQICRCSQGFCVKLADVQYRAKVKVVWWQTKAWA